MKAFAEQIKRAANCPSQRTKEHHPHRARLLREEIRKQGKTLYQLSAAELIAANKKVDEQQGNL